MPAINHYLSVYKGYLSNNASKALSFRVNFLLLFFVDLAFYISAFGSVSFIFDHVDRIGPWSRDEFLFFVAFTSAINQLQMTFFAMSFWELSSDLKQGKLDFHLVKPIGIFFPVFFRHMRFGSLLNFPIPWAAMIYFGQKVELSLLDWLLLPLFVLLGLTLLICISIFVSSAMFWTFEGTGINFIRMQLDSLSRWPNFIYNYFFQKAFTFLLPVLLIASAPVHFLLDTSGISLLLFMLAAIIIMIFLNSIVWKIALRRYESASS